MFEARSESVVPGRVTRYCISSEGSRLSYSQILSLWSSSGVFRKYFTKLLADSPFAGYRWETPALNDESVDHPFEFVLVDSPGFVRRETDASTYREYFNTEAEHHGVVSFTNLRGDATLIVPSPRTDIDVYGHLASFIRRAPEPQVDAFWTVIGDTVKKCIGKNPIWLSTAGGGVAWLHVRLDSRPKYYCYSPYK